MDEALAQQCIYGDISYCGVSLYRIHQLLRRTGVLADFYDLSCFIPFARVQANLILESDMVTDLEGWKFFCVFRPPLSSFHVTVP